MNSPKLLAAMILGCSMVGLPAQELTVTNGLQLWLRADAGITAGAGGAVTGWADQSGNANDAVQFDEAWAPIRVENAANGLPVLRFDGVDDFLEVFDSDSLSIAGDITSFFIVNFSNFGGFRAVWGKTVNNLPGPTDYYTVPDSGVPRLYRGDGTASSLGFVDGAPLRAGSYLLVGFDSASGQVTHYLGAQPTRSGTIAASLADGDTSLYIGTRGDFFTKLQGDLAELVIYDRALSAEERAQVVDYLATRYDIQNQPPTISLTANPAGPGVPAGSTITLTAEATDPDGAVARVEFLSNGATIATATAAPYRATVILESPGDYELAARAVDDKDAQTLSSPMGFNVESAGEPSLAVTNNLQLWLRADAGLTAAAGGAVTTWSDQSPAGNDASQADEALAPTLVADAVAGRPAVRFDGIDDYLDVADSDSLSIAGDITSLFVVRMENFDTFRAVWGKTLSNLPAPTDYYTLPSSGVPRLYRGNAEGSLGSTDGGSALRAGVFELAGFSASGPSIMHVLNGTVTSTGVINATLADRDTALKIGSRDDLVTKLQGELAELLIYDAALTEEDRRQAELYLATRYAIGVVTVSNTPPEVTLSAPAAGVSYAAPTNVLVEVSAMDPDGSVVRVDFLVNGALAASDSSAPFSASIDFSAAAEPVLTAVAIDNFGMAGARSQPVAVHVTSADLPALPAPAHLKLWLRADEGVTAENGIVSAWEDQSGNLNHAFQTNLDFQPFLVDGAINGEPAIRFDGEDDSLTVSNHFSIALVGDLTSFFVIRVDDFDSFRAIWAKTQGNLPRATDYYLVPDPAGIPRALRGGMGLGSVDGLQPLLPGEYAIAGFDMAGTTLTHYLNGAPNGEGEISVPLQDAGTPLRIGTRDDGGTRLRGEIAELILYSKALSPAERGEVLDYLSEKYAIAVVEGPPALEAVRSADQITISWPAEATGFILETTGDLPGGTWTPVAGVANNSVTISTSTGIAFFRLRQP
jgi:hypothetical protein